ncbi:hypothetical protein KDA_12730 [Dictyobacter alpinus]|uniref:Response regulatory domain-containing protein n=1 Tax=Dictyobacter alpinus TaxID=2014873 RepID=A0A402B362_9CHLR|nr:response regulator [Dictyobacter alpinus]GCE25789.1 hypothetical protein KDA_12730 [Dictyobacter alpinus]
MNQDYKDTSQEKKILIVEDDPNNGEFLTLVISQETDFIPYLATNADEALKTVQSMTPDLFILDYFLPPGINGFELYQQLHTITGLQNVPTIFLSASTERDVIKQSNVLFLEKPFELDELLKTINKLMQTPPYSSYNVEG